MLTPCANDPRRKEELKRRERQPHTFGKDPEIAKTYPEARKQEDAYIKSKK